MSEYQQFMVHSSELFISCFTIHSSEFKNLYHVGVIGSCNNSCHVHCVKFLVRVIWAYGFWLFLKAFNWETDLWATLGDFTVKKRKIGTGNLYLPENWLSRNEMWCAADNYNDYMCRIWIFRFNLFIYFLRKYRIFTKLPQISHTSKSRSFEV